MARTCTICSHPERMEIDAAIAIGTPFRNIVERFTVALGSISRHKEHIAEAVQEAQKAQDVQTAITVMGDLDWLRSEAQDLYAEMRKDTTDYRPVVQLLGEMRQQAKLRAELTGELDQRTQVNIQQTPDWHEMRAAFLQALSDLPEAKARVLRLMEARSA